MEQQQKHSDRLMEEQIQVYKTKVAEMETKLAKQEVCLDRCANQILELNIANQKLQDVNDSYKRMLCDDKVGFAAADFSPIANAIGTKVDHSQIQGMNPPPWQ